MAQNATSSSVPIVPASDTPARLEPLLNRTEFRLHVAGVIAWLLAIVYFYAWWLQPNHIIHTGWYVLNTVVLVWLTVMPLYLMALYLRARVHQGKVALPAGSRVAMVVTKAPSEPWPVLRETLEAMRTQDYPHDTWLADEDPSPATIKWCKTRGVKISTRKNVAEYHRQTWPRRTRCKEGNLAYFYDHYGYEQYDFVVQLDADHVPARNYLREMLKPFADPKIGYVSAPSICNRNAGSSWAARSRLFVEATVHGLMQAAYSNGWAPLCIGSHYAVRTKALKEIGGLGPELAEDHSTTLMMNAHGWRGVHALNAIAHGDGPTTFTALITQEFQWARSLVTILLQYSPTLIPRLPMHLRFQFLFCQLWYPLVSFFMLMIFLMPILALATGKPFANVTFIDFFIHAMPAELIILLLALRWKSKGWLRPFNARLISWEGLVFQFVKWPWMLAGTLFAVRDYFTGRFVDFRVTPKGKNKETHLPLIALAPYVVLAAISGLAVFLCSDARNASGFYFFAILNCAIYGGIVVLVIGRHIIENQIEFRPDSALAAARYAACAALMMLPVAGLAVRGPAALEGVTWGSESLRLTKATYSASGAGQRGDRIRHLRFTFFSNT